VRNSPPPPAGASALDVAERCRRAGLEFVNDSPEWDKAELAGWLVGPYRDATWTGSYPPRPPRSVSDPPRPNQLGDVIAEARWRVLSVLESVALDARSVGRLTSHPAVQRFVDARGAAGFRPLDVARMRLSDRVLSLFAADARARPSDYARGGVRVCALCERVTIRGAGRARCACARSEDE
jgi:hypothetical protein